MKVIMHNSISLDGCYTGFEVDMGLHYQVAGWFGAEIYLIGSMTARSGALMAGSVPDEEPSDFVKQQRKGPVWAIVDTKGLMMGLMHVFRRSPFCGDIVVLVSKNTKKGFIKYLEKRQYDYIVAGDKMVDLKKALSLLDKKYSADSVLVDSGPRLSYALFSSKLVDEVSLIVCPEAVGGESLFPTLPPLELLKAKKYGNFAWLHYRVVK